MSRGLGDVYKGQENPVASEELFGLWAKSTGIGLPTRAPGDPLPRLILDGLLTADFEPNGLCREARIWWHSRAERP